ncbi:MAG: hypothetical protein M3019_11350 [Candidatus Dormibacteraeota bacterium]|nr:hypothetical protein [Candidatus Dormibacteraeota bacterium]
MTTKTDPPKGKSWVLAKMVEMAAVVPQNGAKPTPGIRVAAEYRWAHPDATWADVAAAAGCHRNTLERWRDTEAWEVALRQAGAAQIADLAPAAIAGLLKSWRRGNASGAIEVLRALGFLRLPRAEAPAFNHQERDLDAEIQALVDAAGTNWQSG